MRNTQPNPGSTQSAYLHAIRSAVRSAAFVSAATFTSISASAQTPDRIEMNPPASVRPVYSALSEDRASLDLPDAPSAIGIGSSTSASEAPSGQNIGSALSPGERGTATLPEADSSQRYPLPGQPAPVLTSGDKVRMGFTGAFSVFSIFGWFSAAGWEQLTDSSPNFGTDRGAFGQRVWSSAARATSENLLSDSVFAPVFHEDPRYYALGPTHRLIPRVLYAATRSIITRSDSGATVPNLSQIFGNAAGSALTYAYYPQSNRTAKDTAETFGSSLGGTALGDVVAEFFGRILYNHTR